MATSLSALVNPGLEESPHSAEATETTRYRKIAWIKSEDTLRIGRCVGIRVAGLGNCSRCSS